MSAWESNGPRMWIRTVKVKLNGRVRLIGLRIDMREGITHVDQTTAVNGTWVPWEFLAGVPWNATLTEARTHAAGWLAIEKARLANGVDRRAPQWCTAVCGRVDARCYARPDLSTSVHAGDCMDRSLALFSVGMRTGLRFDCAA